MGSGKTRFSLFSEKKEQFEEVIAERMFVLTFDLSFQACEVRMTSVGSENAIWSTWVTL